MDTGLAGKVTLITGGTRGIGFAVARAFAAEGAALFITARDGARLQQTAEQLSTEFGIVCEWAEADFLIEGQAASAAEKALRTFGRVDILVNNAGRSMPGDLTTADDEWRKGLQLHLLSPLEIVRAVLPRMKAQKWGRIINISGISFRQPRGILNAALPGKFGLIWSSKVLAGEFAIHGVTMNTVSVGMIESHQVNEIHFPGESMRNEYAHQEIPAERFGLPAEVAPAVVFLAAEAVSYITGSVLTVDGGMVRATL